MTRSIIDFYAPWCTACASLDQDLNAAAAHIIVERVDVEQQPEVADKYHVASLPTVLLVEDGTVVQRLSGAGASTRQALYEFSNGF